MWPVKGFRSTFSDRVNRNPTLSYRLPTLDRDMVRKTFTKPRKTQNEILFSELATCPRTTLFETSTTYIPGRQALKNIKGVFDLTTQNLPVPLALIPQTHWYSRISYRKRLSETACHLTTLSKPHSQFHHKDKTWNALWGNPWPYHTQPASTFSSLRTYILTYSDSLYTGPTKQTTLVALPYEQVNYSCTKQVVWGASWNDNAS